MPWRRWARAYGTALMLNLALVGDMPDRRGRPTIGIEREVDQIVGRFDGREVIGATVLTVPLDLGRAAAETGRGASLN